MNQVLAFLFGALVASVLAYETYHPPLLPCEWTMKREFVENHRPTAVWEILQQVNGRFMRYKYYTMYDTEEIILRSDLDDSLLAQFVYSSEGNSETFVSYDSVKKMYKMLSDNAHEFDFMYDTKEKSNCNGKFCYIYTRGTDVLYTDFYDIPFYEKHQNYEMNYTWEWKADLSSFAFKPFAAFNDDRIYTPPKEDDVSYWEKKSNDCVLYTGKCNSSGGVYVNRDYLCISADENNTNVCVKGKCGSVEQFIGAGAAVIIEIQHDVKEQSVKLTQLQTLICEKTKIKENAVSVALNVSLEHDVTQIVVFTNNAQDARAVADYADNAGKSGCNDNVLCWASSSRVVMVEVSSGHRVSSVSFFTLFLMMVLAFVAL